MDVFVVSSIAASQELNELSLWIIDQNFSAQCGTNGSISTAAGMGCFSVDGSVVIGTWISLAAISGTYASLVYTVMQTNQSQRELEDNEQGDLTEKWLE